MGTSWKPVQPTEIRDINIIMEVIAQIRKPIPPEVYARLEERDRKLAGVMRPIDPEVKARAWAKPQQDEQGEKPDMLSCRTGFMKGQISMPPDFDTMGQSEIAALFEGNP